MADKAVAYSASLLKGEKSQRSFSGGSAAQVAMPLGGIGAGCICLNGHGGLQDFAIRNRPQTTAASGGPGDAAFALLHIKGSKPVTRLAEGPYPTEKIYTLGLKPGGNLGGGHEGIPRFRRCTFRGEYPFGYVRLSDPDLPIRISITAFNPFIPLDDKNSSIPCAILEYTLHNSSKRRVNYEFSYHLSHLAAAGAHREAGTTGNTPIPGRGVFFHNTEHPNAESFGSAGLSVVGGKPLIKTMWLRGGWFDAISALHREVATGTFHPNNGSPRGKLKGRNGGSILMAGSLKPGAKVTYPILITWYFPNVHLAIGQPAKRPDASCGQGNERTNQPARWRPYYTSQWKDAQGVADYVSENYHSLRTRTQAFHKALFSSTLPSYVLDAVSANLAILKSPTVLRQQNGNLWAWEGCFPDAGSCYGSCTHVWNYAQALPHLFPQLERTLREQELLRSMDRRGHVSFRSALPDGPPHHKMPAAADGQLGGVMKLYRDWQICGDLQWLKRMYPPAKKSIDYCIATWDPRRQGVLVEPHHNTYDIEFWGPDGMCSSIYVAALAAMAELAHDAGRPKDAPSYHKLAAKGAEHLDAKLFNGRYFEQKVTYKGLGDTSFAKLLAQPDNIDRQMLQLLRKEGPKYQYGRGCISDGVIGTWMARIYGINTPQNQANVRKHLKAVFRHNFKADLSKHVCTQRPGFALGAEPGLLLCTWPRGGKPTLPFVYSDEVWTGIEYQVASHLIETGLVGEGLTIVKAARSRYDGRVRNPWNEYECGSYYARAMASYALLGSLSGFRYSAAKKTLWFGPKLTAKKFKTFFSTASGFGTITLTDGAITVEMIEGRLAVDKLYLTCDGKTKRLDCSLVARAGRKAILKPTG